MITLVVSIVVLLYIFSPTVRVGGLNLNSQLILLAPAALLLAFHAHKRIDFQWARLIVYFLVFMCVLTLVSATVNFADMEFLQFNVYAILFLLNSFFVVSLSVSLGYEWTRVSVAKCVTIAACINVAVSLGAIFLPDMMPDLTSVLFTPEEEFLASGSERYSGFSSFGGSLLSVVYAIIIAINVEQARKSGFEVARLPLLSLSTVLLLVGIVFSGRSGFVVLAIFLVAVIFREVLRLNVSFLLTTAAVSIVVVAIILASFAYIGDSVMRRAFEFYYRYLEEGVFYTQSTDVLLGYDYGEIARSVSFIGDGNFGRSKTLPYLPYDPIVIRALLGGGIVVLCLALFPLVYFFWLGIRKSSELAIIGVAFLLFALKEVSIMGVFGLTPLLFLFLHIIWTSEFSSSGSPT